MTSSDKIAIAAKHATAYYDEFHTSSRPLAAYIHDAIEEASAADQAELAAMRKLFIVLEESIGNPYSQEQSAKLEQAREAAKQYLPKEQPHA